MSEKTVTIETKQIGKDQTEEYYWVTGFNGSFRLTKEEAKQLHKLLGETLNDKRT